MASNIDNIIKNQLKNAKDEIMATINGEKRITSVYKDDFENIYIDIPDSIIVKNVGKSPFTWICRKEDLVDMSIITFIWANIDTMKQNGERRIHNAYFNGYMFGYTDEKIMQFYLNSYAYSNATSSNDAIKFFETDKNELQDSLKYCKTLQNYKEWVTTYFPEIL